jgi:hypothetical protein
LHRRTISSSLTLSLLWFVTIFCRFCLLFIDTIFGFLTYCEKSFRLLFLMTFLQRPFIFIQLDMSLWFSALTIFCRFCLFSSLSSRLRPRYIVCFFC